MKTIKFLQDCHDKFTNEPYKTGDEKEFEDARADEILALEGIAEEVVKGAVEDIAEENTEEAVEEVPQKPKKKK